MMNSTINMRASRTAWLGALAAVGLLLATGCTRHVSRDISDQGVAGEVIFPETDKAWLPEGTFPNPANVRLIGPGMSKDQLYALIGVPHFREGYAGVREWDYIFNFRKDGKVVTCHYKIIYDKDYLAQSFHWMPESCADIIAEQGPAPAAAAAMADEDETFNIEGDGLFAFAKWGINDLTGNGRKSLDNVADKLKQATRVREVMVLAHTDRIGSDPANLALSERRAGSVRDYLVSKGVDGSRIQARGMGEAQAVKACDESMGRDAEIACLAPNRRVEIRASATREK